MEYKPNRRTVYMSCGHYEEKDFMTTGEQLSIDLQYYATQGICKECWSKLRKHHAMAIK